MKTAVPEIMTTVQTCHIHLEGKVQGVGFRPFVYRLARECRLGGWVNNTVDGVHIEVSGQPEVIDHFYQRLLSEYPAIAQVVRSSRRDVGVRAYGDFRVVSSEDGGAARVLMLPDLDLCDKCRAEMDDPGNRRHRYPFITCTDCGPRFSIMTRLPYDRPHTSMDPFFMCPTCQAEYDDPAERRFYSQTNSCPDCGITLSLLSSSGEKIESGNAALLQTAAAIRDGQIVAIKGLGGYLLVVDACNGEAVQRLRTRKHRPAKPFALMCRDLDMALRYATVIPEEAALLESRAKPIVIVNKRQDREAVADAVAPGQDTLGIMLPCTPLHHLLMREFPGPVVATSANISGSPILYREKQIFENLGTVVDAVLSHDREIVVPQDDSVLRFSREARRPVFLRRSRSYAPLVPHQLLEIDPQSAILALGAQQKSAIALSSHGNLYLSHYLGELGSYETELNFRKTYHHFRDMLAFTPAVIAVDQHPQYAATLFGEELAAKLAIPVIRVQHHKAHFWALLAEKQRLQSDRKILGVVWDGTGLGEDGNIWGGEFFRYGNGEMTRVAHLREFPLLMGDKAARETRLCALGLWAADGEAEMLLRNKFSDTEWGIYQRFLEQGNFFRTTSMGRLFDGVAGLMGLADRVSFEGEAAIQLEKLAR
ncbi:MAG: carbamoyltransferase HypF, partial [Calditrichaeota bacterium]|nr:carbamoyltransferase HypF [Calditrichota bacterium]